MFSAGRSLVPGTGVVCRDWSADLDTGGSANLTECFELAFRAGIPDAVVKLVDRGRDPC